MYKGEKERKRKRERGEPSGCEDPRASPSSGVHISGRSGVESNPPNPLMSLTPSPECSTDGLIKPSSKTMQKLPNATTSASGKTDLIAVGELVAENAVIVFGQRGCCMCHVVKLLLLGLGVNPTISAVDEGDVGAVIGELLKISGEKDGELMEFPVVFVGGKLFGGLEKVMATHITGELVPMLKEAKALWL